MRARSSVRFHRDAVHWIFGHILSPACPRGRLQRHTSSPPLTLFGVWAGDDLTVTNCTFSTNEASEIHRSSANPTVTTCVLWGDTAKITPLDLDGEGRFFGDPDTPDTGCGHVPIMDMGACKVGDTGPQPCFGDLDDDWNFALSDVAALLADCGESDIHEGDLSCDGDVGVSDLSALLGVCGTTCE